MEGLGRCLCFVVLLYYNTLIGERCKTSERWTVGMYESIRWISVRETRGVSCNATCCTWILRWGVDFYRLDYQAQVIWEISSTTLRNAAANHCHEEKFQQVAFSEKDEVIWPLEKKLRKSRHNGEQWVEWLSVTENIFNIEVSHKFLMNQKLLWILIIEFAFMVFGFSCVA